MCAFVQSNMKDGALCSKDANTASPAGLMYQVSVREARCDFKYSALLMQQFLWYLS